MHESCKIRGGTVPILLLWVEAARMVGLSYRRRIRVGCVGTEQITPPLPSISAHVFTWGLLSGLPPAPFGLEATLNYKARIEEAGFTWPPVARIAYQTKTW
jgi:hypothetical protein